MNCREFYLKYASVFARQYQIGFCSVSELNELLAFIERYWKAGHPLAQSRTLMDWQHYDKENDRYNFVLARHRETGELHAILGFIPTTQYAQQPACKAMWGAIWKAREDVALPGIGVGIMGYLCNYFPEVPIMGLGISDQAWKLYRRYGAFIGHVNRYYILHPDKREFKLCHLHEPDLRAMDADPLNACTFTSPDAEQALCLPDSLWAACPPYKDKMYYCNRYMHHPFYVYHMQFVSNRVNGDAGLIVWRFCEHNGARCIRIVDYAGPIRALAGAAQGFKAMLREYDAEFIDFINYGFEKREILNAGFVDVADTSNTLAHYFEPYMPEGINTRFFFCSQGKTMPVMFFKGDGDQDRPNILAERR